MKELNIEKRTVLKCESCHGFHSEEDCEYVIIKVIKGKKCPLPNQNIFEKEEMNSVTSVNPVIPEIFVKKEEIKSTEKIKSNHLDNPNVVKLLTPEELKGYRTENKVIPREFSNMAIPPTASNFEEKGLKSNQLSNRG